MHLIEEQYHKAITIVATGRPPTHQQITLELFCVRNSRLVASHLFSGIYFVYRVSSFSKLFVERFLILFYRIRFIVWQCRNHVHFYYMAAPFRGGTLCRHLIMYYFVSSVFTLKWNIVLYLHSDSIY